MPKPKFDVVVIGSCCIDLFCYVSHYPKPGETVRASKFIECLGGKGANQAVQCAMLGANVSMISKIGRDAFGENSKQQLKALSINCDCVTESQNESTGKAFITVLEETGEGHFVYVPGANADLSIEDLHAAEHVIKDSKLMMCQLGVPRASTLEAMKIGRRNKVKVIFNAAPVVRNFNLEFLRFTDILCVNEREAKSLINHHSSLDEDQKNEMMTSIEPIMGYLFDSYENMEIIIITLGCHGCCFATKSIRSVRTVTSPNVHVVDTTGAGDSFLGAVAYYLTNCPFLDLEEVMSRSCIIASTCVPKLGSTISYSAKQNLSSSLFL